MTRAGSATLLIALVGVVFGQTVLGGFVWDDEVLISANARLRGQDALKHALTDDFWATSVPADARPGFWRPVVKLSHVAVVALGGQPWTFHLLNVLLHLACVLLVHSWLRERLERDGVEEGEAARPALLAAALFAVHPTRFEAVGWISCSTDLFMTCFALAGLRAFSARRYWLGALAIALAMLSKESILPLPAALLVDGLLRRQLDRRAVMASGAAVVGVLALRVALGLRTPPVSLSSPLETGARGVAALGGNAARTLWPFPATIAPFELRPGAGLADLDWRLVALGASVLLAMAVASGVARRRPAGRSGLADVAWWVVLLVPFLELVPRGTSIFVSDRFLYLPLVGPCALVARSLAGARPAIQHAMWATVLGAAAVTTSALPAYTSGLDFFGREFSLHPRSTTIGSSYAGQLQRSGQDFARRVLLERLARQRDDVRTACWATAQLANTTLTLTVDGDRPTLEGLARFYEKLRLQRPEALDLPGGRFEVPDPTLLVRLAVHGVLDDLRLHEATALLQLGRVEEAWSLTEPLLLEPTTRRLTLAARLQASRGDYGGALATMRRVRSPRSQELTRALEGAISLPDIQGARCDGTSPCDGEQRAVIRGWVEVFHQLAFLDREDAALAALGADQAAAELRVRALLRRRRFAEALELARSLGETTLGQVMEEVSAQRQAQEREEALVGPG